MATARPQAYRSRSIGKDPPPVPPLRKMLRGRPAYGVSAGEDNSDNRDSVTQIPSHRVLETRSGARSPSDRDSTTSSVETTLHRPLSSGETGESGGSGSGSTTVSGSRGSDGTEPSSGRKSHDERDSIDTGIFDPLVAKTQAIQSSDENELPKETIARFLDKSRSLHDAASRDPVGQEARSSSRVIPRYGQARRHDWSSIQNSNPSTRDGAFLIPSPIHAQQRREKNAPDGPDNSNIRPRPGRIGGPDLAARAPHEEQIADHDLQRMDRAAEVSRARPVPRYHETTRDGVPILMHQTSGVWVETVEGVDLTTKEKPRASTQHQSIPIPEIEAEEVREIVPFETQQPRLPVTQQRRVEQDQHRVLGDEATIQRTTVSQSSQAGMKEERRRSTEKWAELQAQLGSRSQTSSEDSQRPPDQRLRVPWPATDCHPKKNAYVADPVVSPFWPNHQQSNSSGSAGKSSTNHNSTDSSSSGAASKDSSNTSPLPLKSRRPTDRHGQTVDRIPSRVAKAIDESVASVEQAVYGTALKPKRSVRFQEATD
jgi:hypothetical protein